MGFDRSGDFLWGFFFQLYSKSNMIHDMIRILSAYNIRQTYAYTWIHVSRRDATARVKKCKSLSRSVFLFYTLSCKFHLRLFVADKLSTGTDVQSLLLAILHKQNSKKKKTEKREPLVSERQQMLANFSLTVFKHRINIATNCILFRLTIVL